MGKRLEQTAKFLKDVLGEGPLPSQQAWEEAQRTGYSRRTYDRARKALLVKRSMLIEPPVTTPVCWR
jgi:hypothetical protein